MYFYLLMNKDFITFCYYFIIKAPQAMKATQESKAPKVKTPYDSKLNIHIRLTIIIIYEVPNCKIWKATDHIITLYAMKESYDMTLSGTT